MIDFATQKLADRMKADAQKLAELLEELRIVGIDLPGDRFEELIQEIAKWGGRWVGQIPLK